jgi:hypothetical protein
LVVNLFYLPDYYGPMRFLTFFDGESGLITKESEF